MHRKLYIIIWLLVFVHAGTLQAQGGWPLKQFKKEQKAAVQLPHAGRQYWLFEKDGSRGIYSEATEEIVVPARYELVLPSLEEGLFYVVRGSFVGLYAAKGGELIAPTQLKRLQITTTGPGNLVVQDGKAMPPTEYSEPGLSGNTAAYALSLSADSAWQATATEPQFWPSPFPNRHEDGMENLSENIWLHNHAHLQTTEVEMDGHMEPWTKLTSVVALSGIVSSPDGKYLIPPDYVSISSMNGYFLADKAAPLSQEPTEKSVYTTSQVYTPDYREVIRPGYYYKGSVDPEGFFLGSDDGTLLAFRSGGKEVTAIGDHAGCVLSLMRHGDKYYLQCFSGNEQQMEMSIPDLFVYSLDGELLHKMPLGLISYADRRHIVPFERLVPDQPYVLGYGLFDLKKGEMVTSTDYDAADRISYRETLLPQKDDTCTWCFDLAKEGMHFYFSCTGEVLTGQSADVRGANYYVTAAGDAAASSFGEPATAPFDFTHVLLFASQDPMLEPGLAAIKETEKHGLIVYKAYDVVGKKTVYGLGYADEGSLLLAPVFDTIKFQESTSDVLLNYNGATFQFPLRRYER